MVTSRYHIFRARLIIERCFHGTLRMVDSTPTLTRYLINSVLEWPKLAVALALRRRC